MRGWPWDLISTCRSPPGAHPKNLLKVSGVSPQNGNGRTPAVIALFGLHRWWRNEEKPEILDLLLKSGAEYKMLIAATLGDEERVRELLRGDPSLANAADPCWRRPLSGAASKGHTAIVRLLLDKGAEVNVPGGLYGSDMQAAAYHGQAAAVRLLRQPSTSTFRLASRSLHRSRTSVPLFWMLWQKMPRPPP